MADVFDTKTDGGNSEENLLDALVGEGRKFKTVEELAKGKLNADNHIESIEQENAKLKLQNAELQQAQAKADSVTDLLEAVRNQSKESSEGAATMTSEELAQMVKTVMKDEKSAETKAFNRSQGNSLVLKLADGNVDTARLLVAEKAEALGMTPQALATLSESSPSAFAELMSTIKPNPKSDGSTNNLPGKRTEYLDGNTRQLEIDGFKTKAWFDGQKKEMGHVKYIQSPQIQSELRKSISGLGDRFNN